LNISYPFPYTTDLAFTSQTVFGLISPYITRCPYTYTINPAVNVIIPVSAPANTTSPANPSQYAVTANDVNALNFALTLELLEATFYNRYLSNPSFNDSAFQSAGYTSFQRAYFEVVRAHENMHVVILQQAISGLQFTPVQNCTYNFPVTDVPSFIAVASLLENTGVSAYDGAVNSINDVSLRQAAATIATVEARHAAFITQFINYTNPYSAATDTPLTPTQVVTAITTNQAANNLPLLSGCPSALTLPKVVIIYPYSNSTGTTTSTSTSGSGSGTGGTSTSTSTNDAVTIASSNLITIFVATIFVVVAFML